MKLSNKPSHFAPMRTSHAFSNKNSPGSRVRPWTFRKILADMILERRLGLSTSRQDVKKTSLIDQVLSYMKSAFGRGLGMVRGRRPKILIAG